MIWSERDRDGRTVWFDNRGGRHDSPVTAYLWNETEAQAARERDAAMRPPSSPTRPLTFREHRALWPRVAGLGCALWFAIGWFRRTDMSYVFGPLGRELGGDVATGVLVIATITIYGLVRRLGLRVFDLFRRD